MKKITTYARPVAIQTELDATDVSSHIDIELKTLKSGAISNTTKTGIPNTGDTYTTKVKVNASVVQVSVAGSGAQTFAEVVAAMNTAFTGVATVSLLTDEKRIRITSSTAGNIAIDKVEVGNLITSIKGESFNKIEAEYLPGVTGGGACYRISNLATSDAPVDIVDEVSVTKAADNQPYTTFNKVYDRTRGTLLVMDDGTNEFAVGDKISVFATTY